MNEPVENTDKELWRETPNDYYSPSIFVTEHNSIGINVGGMVYVKPIEGWHKLAEPAKTLTDEEILDLCPPNHSDMMNEAYTIDFARAILKKASEK